MKGIQEVIAVFASELKELLAAELSPHKPKNISFVVGYSGGPDSTAIILALMELAGKHSPLLRPYSIGKIILCHVEHNIQARDSQLQENKIVRDLADRYGLELRSCSLKWKKNEARQEASAREKRLAAIAETAKKEQIQFVITGHHAGDMRETYLMRALGGEGIQGLAGIPKSRNYRVETTQVCFIKPALQIDKKNLHNLLTDQVFHHEQSMNNKRDTMRTTLLPELMRVFPMLDKSVQRMNEQVRDLFDDLDQRIPFWFVKNEFLWLLYGEFIRLTKTQRLRILYKGANLLGLTRLAYQSLLPFLCESVSRSARLSVRDTVLEISHNRLIWRKQSKGLVKMPSPSMQMTTKPHIIQDASAVPLCFTITNGLLQCHDAGTKKADSNNRSYPLKWHGELALPLKLGLLDAHSVFSQLNVYASLGPDATNPIPVIQDSLGTVLVLGACQLKRDVIVQSSAYTKHSVYQSPKNKTSQILKYTYLIRYGYGRFELSYSK